MQEFFHEYAERWLHTPDSFDRRGGLFLVHLGHNIAKPNYCTGPRQAAHYTIHFVREGKVEFMSGKESVILGKGDMFCKFPHTTYMYQIVPGETPLRMMWIAFDGNQALELMTLAGFSHERTYRRNVLDKDMDVILQQIYKTPKHLGKKQLANLYGLMYRMFSQLLPEQENATSSQAKELWVQQSLDFIHACYMEKINVNDIATYVGVHRTHFSKTFTEEIGTAPAKYLQNLRLDKAKQMLQQTRLTVTEVALSVGYLDLFSFTRAFTRQFGCSPSRMRGTAERC
jgi:AraC-like DNA-binding protein